MKWNERYTALQHENTAQIHSPRTYSQYAHTLAQIISTAWTGYYVTYLPERCVRIHDNVLIPVSCIKWVVFMIAEPAEKISEQEI